MRSRGGIHVAFIAYDKQFKLFPSPKTYRLTTIGMGAYMAIPVEEQPWYADWQRGRC
jgi:hypothetical protein